MDKKINKNGNGMADVDVVELYTVEGGNPWAIGAAFFWIGKAIGDVIWGMVAPVSNGPRPLRG